MSDNIIELAKRAPRKIPHENDLANAFADKSADKLRYVAEWSQWHHWDGICWHKERRCVCTTVFEDFAKACIGAQRRSSWRRSNVLLNPIGLWPRRSTSGTPIPAANIHLELSIQIR